jgi:hypothetical protein
MGKIVDSTSCVISPDRVIYDGVRPAQRSEDGPLKWDFNVLYKEFEENPRIFVDMYWDGHSELTVELEDCLPLSAFRALSISTPALLAVAADTANSPNKVVGLVLSILAASVVKLKVRRVEGDQIRISVSLENFTTEKTIDAAAAREFLVPVPPSS